MSLKLNYFTQNFAILKPITTPRTARTIPPDRDYEGSLTHVRVKKSLFEEKGRGGDLPFSGQ